MTMPPVGHPHHEPLCSLIEAVNHTGTPGTDYVCADLAGMKALADCLKIVTVSAINGTNRALLDHLTASLLTTTFAAKRILGMEEEDALAEAAMGFDLDDDEPEEPL